MAKIQSRMTEDNFDAVHDLWRTHMGTPDALPTRGFRSLS